MTQALDDLATAAQALAEAVRALAEDPGDAIRLLTRLAALESRPAAGDDAVALTIAQADAATAALCRRAALASLARAAATAAPPSHEEAVALRDGVVALLAAEELRAADGGDDASALALRDLRAAVDADLTARAADLARLRSVTVAQPLPALVHAWRLFEDIARDDEVSLHAGAADPNFVAGGFLVPER